MKDNLYEFFIVNEIIDTNICYFECKFIWII